MLRLIVSAVLLTAFALPGAADTALQSLRTANDGRGWAAVGRIDIAGKGFCTGALISETLVLTAAHCLFGRDGTAAVAPSQIRFEAGLRNGRAEAYRSVRRVMTHPDYEFSRTPTTAQSRYDLAFIELDQAIRLPQMTPFPTGRITRSGQEVAVVSYAVNRAEAPSLQAACTVLGQQGGAYVMTCDAEFGASGAPVFRLGEAGAEIVSLISAKAMMGDEPVSIGADVGHLIDELRLLFEVPGNAVIGAGGAKFVRP